ncbi:MAG: exodeoxyribonuclease V subunit beta [Deltaproteobacteria bacterium]|nr:exodeoxyribonuclease V subunit beta [Deltaproteobacteria bacterium]MBW2301234.1 exodeoxyribonuclease V subunit beta [Deltaproteobacteria bacterium]
MQNFKQFDLLQSSLEGTNLIEASAGTGKTYTVACLFLRLILEKHLGVNEILVLTFTEAAVEELKDRIRTKLRQALDALRTGKSEDQFLIHLLDLNKDRRHAFSLVEEAIRAFDEASIFTIHGFCLRMLRDNAFESGSLFDTELVTEDDSLKREIVEDFWRNHFYQASPLFVRYALKNRVSPQSLLSLLSNRTGQPYLSIKPEVNFVDPAPQEETLKAMFDKVRDQWPSVRNQVEEVLRESEALKRTIYRKDKIPELISAMDEFITSSASLPFLFKGFDKFTMTQIRNATKSGYTPPVHSFFQLCEELSDVQKELEKLYSRCLLWLKRRMFVEVGERLEKEKRQRNIQTFDDLLLKMKRALEGKGGESLSKAIRSKFKAALVDEFQDTDPVQYFIFKKVFSRKGSILFFIGDPKQAIYSFRGADIFTYMGAAGEVQRKFTLGENWRSEPDLVNAVSTVFGNADAPFLYEAIEFHQPAPVAGKEPQALQIDGKCPPPLQIWFLDARKWTDNAKPLGKTVARKLVSKAVAGEISRLLALSKNGRALIGERPLAESDIAVLVRRNSEASMMKEALSELGIQSVLFSTGNLFETREAMEVERVMSAIVEPTNAKLIKAALATDMLGMRGEELEDLSRDDAKWEEWLVRFKSYRELWHERGFIRMFRAFLSEQNILTRLIALPEGERRVTNVLHIMEVAHRIGTEKKLDMTGLLKWLSEQVASDTTSLEEHQLRLESDENAVKLVTIHKSKGLEYPVVFCPFSWDGSRIKRNRNQFTFHDEVGKMKLTLDLGSEEAEKNRLLAEKEQLAENLRLLYVSLTRARSYVYWVWGRINEAETSAPAYLLHPVQGERDDDIVEAVEKRFSSLSDEDVFSELRSIQEKSGGCLRIAKLPVTEAEKTEPQETGDQDLSCLRFSGIIDREWKVSSFSSLVSSKWGQEDLPDYDSLDIPESEEPGLPEESSLEVEPSGIFSFPRGTRAGTFLHDLFEHLDFASNDASTVEGLAEEKLQQYGFETTWASIVCEMIGKVLSVPLKFENTTFNLSMIQNTDRLNELEFYFPLKKLSAGGLQEILAKHKCPASFSDVPEHMEKLDFAPLRGFMKGFMDMVFRFRERFYLVDWKSNFLGSRVEDYSPLKLSAAMEESYYVLQYLIYTVALNQYLKLRIPRYSYENYFGCVYYVFLRGVDPEKGPEFGVYKDRPPAGLIDELSKAFIG